MATEGRKWLEQQLPGLEDSPLWVDLGIIISIPLDVRPGLTNVVSVRRLDHVNFLDFHRRTCTVDTNTSLALSTLPTALEDQIQDYQEAVFRQAHPFM